MSHHEQFLRPGVQLRFTEKIKDSHWTLTIIHRVHLDGRVYVVKERVHNWIVKDRDTSFLRSQSQILAQGISAEVLKHASSIDSRDKLFIPGKWVSLFPRLPGNIRKRHGSTLEKGGHSGKKQQYTAIGHLIASAAGTFCKGLDILLGSNDDDMITHVTDHLDGRVCAGLHMKWNEWRNDRIGKEELFTRTKDFASKVSTSGHTFQHIALLLVTFTQYFQSANYSLRTGPLYLWGLTSGTLARLVSKLASHYGPISTVFFLPFAVHNCALTATRNVCDNDEELFLGALTAIIDLQLRRRLKAVKAKHHLKLLAINPIGFNDWFYGGEEYDSVCQSEHYEGFTGANRASYSHVSCVDLAEAIKARVGGVSEDYDESISFICQNAPTIAGIERDTNQISASDFAELHDDDKITAILHGRLDDDAQKQAKTDIMYEVANILSSTKLRTKCQPNYDLENEDEEDVSSDETGPQSPPVDENAGHGEDDVLELTQTESVSPANEEGGPHPQTALSTLPANRNGDGKINLLLQAAGIMLPLPQSGPDHYPTNSPHTVDAFNNPVSPIQDNSYTNSGYSDCHLSAGSSHEHRSDQIEPSYLSVIRSPDHGIVLQPHLPDHGNPGIGVGFPTPPSTMVVTHIPRYQTQHLENEPYPVGQQENNNGLSTLLADVIEGIQGAPGEPVTETGFDHTHTPVDEARDTLQREHAELLGTDNITASSAYNTVGQDDTSDLNMVTGLYSVSAPDLQNTDASTNDDTVNPDQIDWSSFDWSRFDWSSFNSDWNVFT